MLKPDYIDSMKLWANQNSEFAIWLWVDKKSAASEASWAATLEHYKLLPNRTELKDIEDCKDQLGNKVTVSDEYIRYEIDKLTPNYGASSDLLRYIILYQFGGAYFDFDIVPGAISLAESRIFDTD